MKRNKRILFIMIVLSALTVFSHNIEEAVTTVKSPTGDKESIYVAGNPDFFPMEYYDESDDAYKGVMPLLLERISESTGTDFVYVSAGKDDKRKQLASNGQVELVSAYKGQDKELWNTSIIIPYHSDSIRMRDLIGCASGLHPLQRRNLCNPLKPHWNPSLMMSFLRWY